MVAFPWLRGCETAAPRTANIPPECAWRWRVRVCGQTCGPSPPRTPLQLNSRAAERGGSAGGSPRQGHKGFGEPRGVTAARRERCREAPPPGTPSGEGRLGSGLWRGGLTVTFCGGVWFLLLPVRAGKAIFYWRSSFSVWPACHRKGPYGCSL